MCVVASVEHIEDAAVNEDVDDVVDCTVEPEIDAEGLLLV